MLVYYIGDKLYGHIPVCWYRPVRVNFVRFLRQPRACQVAEEQLEGSCVLMV